MKEQRNSVLQILGEFNDRNATLEVDFFPHRLHSKLCFVSPNKIRIQFLFHSHIIVDYLNYC